MEWSRKYVHSTIRPDFANYYSEGRDISYIVDLGHGDMRCRHSAENSYVQEQPKALFESIPQSPYLSRNYEASIAH